jgi:uncharacterized membrane protein
MIDVHQDSRTGAHRIVLQPNNSMSKRQSWTLLATLAVAMGTIAAFFAGMGAWLVFPFAGAEWLLLAYCFNRVLRKLAIREVITITDDSIVVERGRRRPEQVHQLHRHWTVVEWERPLLPAHMGRVYLRLHGRRIELGAFLAETERERLASDLQRILVKLRTNNMSLPVEERAL